MQLSEAAVARRLTWRGTALALLALGGALGVLGAASTAQARPLAFEVSAHLAGVLLGSHLEFLADPGGQLGIDDVVTPHVAARFAPCGSPAPTFGMTRETYWLRLTVRNRALAAQPWLIEIGYPALDYVTLYAPRPGGGFQLHETGDRVPFASRDIAYRNFLFTVEEPLTSEQTYYLRVRTEGSMVLPLKAFTSRELFEHQNTETPIVWMFYGLMLVMACYNLFIYTFVRQREYLYYVLYIVSFATIAFSLNGHMFQYFLPNQPWLANRMMVLSIASMYFWVCNFVGSSLSLPTMFPRLNRLIRTFVAISVALFAAGWFLPYGVVLRAVTAMGATLVTVGPMVILYCARAGSRPAKLFLVAWGCLIMGAILHYSQLLGVLPIWFATQWGLQIGASLEVVLLSVALADRINGLRSDLSSLNRQLSQHVDDLKLALSRAEQAARAKSEFLATMSHELRTPLNAIINIPQGLAGDFQASEGARCKSCGASFQLDQGERVSADISCPECRMEGQLEAQPVRAYAGEPAQTLHHLGVVESAGKHLLEMVNGILDFSKMEAGRVELKLTHARIATFVQEAFDTTAELARRAGVKLELEQIGEATLLCDPLRLKQVLINLIGNAIKFSDGRGVVRVGLRKEHDAYLFSVRDQGIGIAPENVHRIFEQFEQVEQGETRKYGGTGLGLSISRTLVQMHGGEIWAKSAVGAGSTFFFRIPDRQAVGKPSARGPGASVGEAEVARSA